MRNLIFTIGMIVSCVTMAQETVDSSSFIIVYDYKVKTLDDLDIPVTDSMKIVTMVGPRIIKTMPYSNYLKYLNIIPDAKELYFEAIIHYPTIWVNYPSNYVTVQETIMPYKFEAKEKKETISWVLHENDTITIHGFFCKKATTKYAQKDWIVYYTEEIPSSVGPWKLSGLPGLIVEATDQDNIHFFEMSELRQESLPIIFEKNTFYKEVKNKKLVQYRNLIYCNKKYAKKPLYYTNFDISQAKSIFVIQSSNQIWVDDNLMLEKSHVFQPLEY